MYQARVFLAWIMVAGKVNDQVTILAKYFLMKLHVQNTVSTSEYCLHPDFAGQSQNKTSSYSA